MPAVLSPKCLRSVTYALPDWLPVDDECLKGAMILGEEEHSETMIQGNMEVQGQQAEGAAKWFRYA